MLVHCVWFFGFSFSLVLKQLRPISVCCLGVLGSRVFGFCIGFRLDVATLVADLFLAVDAVYTSCNL